MGVFKISANRGHPLPTFPCRLRGRSTTLPNPARPAPTICIPPARTLQCAHAHPSPPHPRPARLRARHLPPHPPHHPDSTVRAAAALPPAPAAPHPAPRPRERIVTDTPHHPTPPTPRNPRAQWVPSPNFGPRQPILIVIHATEQESVQESLDTLRTENSGGPVSSHYLVGDNGDIYQLVADQNRAWHAGPGRWGTITDVNSASIGIELDNDGAEPFAPAQIDSLLRLLDDLCTRYNIPRSAIVAHADFAPTRKRDPGYRFPWKQLADAGFGLWPDEPLADPPPPT